MQWDISMLAMRGFLQCFPRPHFLMNRFSLITVITNDPPGAERP